MLLIVVVCLTAGGGAYREVIADRCTRSHIGDSHLKAIALYPCHVVPTGGEYPCPVEVFTGSEGDFHPAVAVVRSSGVSHWRAIRHYRVRRVAGGGGGRGAGTA